MSSVVVNFLENPNGPKYVYSATLIQERYKHDMLELEFKDWDIKYDVVSPGSPVEVNIKGAGINNKTNFYGYVHHIKPKTSPGTNFTTVYVIGASYIFKNPSQNTFLNTTADTVVNKLAKANGFVCYADPHPRIYKQISQAGQTDWELINKLARQCGYTVRAENTELYFQPILKNYTLYRQSAPVFIMRGAQSTAGSEIYSFDLLVGDSIEYEDAVKSAVAVSGVDVETKKPIKQTQQKANKKTRAKSKPEVFDAFNNGAVALSLDIAKYEAEAAEARNAFPYRAIAEVFGDLSLKPNNPVFLNGIGATYSGYWMVLKAIHKIIEEKTNFYKYTTEIYVGTDSLGESEKWTDNQKILAPAQANKRVIQQGVKQTKVVSKTILKTTSNIKAPQLKAPLSSVKNRAVPTVRGLPVQPNKWKNNKTSSTNKKPEPVKSAAIANRVAKAGKK